jgi:3-phenylpropionate/trans-cinnamate dioxygenase ferredoxin reductase subunit
MTEKLLIIGAGHAAGQLAISLRQRGYDGSITLCGDEALPPYQRPPLSKKYLSGDMPLARLLLKPETFYAEHGIELRLGHRVTTVDRATHTATLDDGTTLGWDRLVFATGSRVRQLSIDGGDLTGIHYLRTVADVDAIRAQFRAGGRLVIVGAGYIGLEVAAVATAHELDVTVIEMTGRVMSRTVSPPISAFYEREHTKAGVRFMLNTGVTAFEGDGRAECVRISGDGVLEADLIIVGVGVEPETGLARDAGIACDDGIVVDEYCQTSDPEILAIGDCTRHPNPLLNRSLRLESVPNALEQAKTAAATLCGERHPYAQVPWFWSDQYDLKLQIAGLAEDGDERVLRGDPASRQFACFHLAEGHLVAVEAVNSPREFMFSKPLIAERAAIPAAVLADPEQSLKDAGNTASS